MSCPLLDVKRNNAAAITLSISAPRTPAQPWIEGSAPDEHTFAGVIVESNQSAADRFGRILLCSTKQAEESRILRWTGELGLLQQLQVQYLVVDRSHATECLANIAHVDCFL